MLAALVAAQYPVGRLEAGEGIGERPDGRGRHGRGRAPHPPGDRGQRRKGPSQAHDVRTRTAGRVTFIEFHLVVPGKMTVATSHQICDRIEAALKEAVHGAEVLIHVEPEAEAKHAGIVPIA